MRYIIFLIPLIILLAGCDQKAKYDKSAHSEAELTNEVINIVKDFAVSQLSNPTTSVDSTGIITMSDGQKKILIDPRRIFTGLIDRDKETDAIATILIYLDEYSVIDEHLILLHRNGCLEFVAAIDRNMKILYLKKRKIVAEFHTKPRSSPLYNCHSCMKVVKYEYREEDLVEVK